MTTILTDDTVLNLEQARDLMTARIREAYSTSSPTDPVETGPGITRLEVAVETIDPLIWLQSQQSPVKTYWYSRDGEFEMAGIGSADIITGDAGDADDDWSRVLTQLNARLTGSDNKLRYFGGCRFDGGGCPPGSPWAGFGSYRFILPQVELLRRSDKTVLAFNLAPSENYIATDGLLEELRGMVISSMTADKTLPEVLHRSDLPSQQEWLARVRSVCESFDSTELQKLVLARQTLLVLSDPPDPTGLLRRLASTGSGCFRFCFQIERHSALVGASPELLYRREEQTVRSEAMAGTRPRGRSANEDRELERQLLTSPKELTEQQFVAGHVRETLQQLAAEDVHEHGPEVLKLATVQHLVTRFESNLASGITDADLLSALPPTPAVGGWPVELALKEISRVEPFDRGWYAGPVGWISDRESEFAVAIRSGLVAGEKIHLYTGAGIVPGSTPEGEWQELQSKLAGFTGIWTEVCSPDLSV